jgi:enoyl reductase-like protein
MRKVEEILNRIRESSISRLLEIGISPVNVHLEFHSVGGVSITEEDFMEHIAKYWKTEGINVITTKRIFSDYRTFPSMS